MSDDEIKAGLRSLDERHPFYRAIMALLAQDHEQELAGATQPGLGNEARQFNAGRLAHAGDILRAVPSVIAAARGEQ